jgi:predicted ester cyclase
MECPKPREDSTDLCAGIYSALVSKLGAESPGRVQTKEVIARRWAVSPDWCEEILDLAVTRKKVVTQHLSSDTHQGEYLGISPAG